MTANEDKARTVALGIIEKLTPTEVEVIRGIGSFYDPADPPTYVPERTPPAPPEDPEASDRAALMGWLQDVLGIGWRVVPKEKGTQCVWLYEGQGTRAGTPPPFPGPGWAEHPTDPRAKARQERIARDRENAARIRQWIARTKDYDYPSTDPPVPSADKSLWVGTSRAADLLGVSAGAIRTWLHRSPGTGQKRKGRVLIRLEHVIWRAMELSGIPPMVPLRVGLPR